MNNVSLDMSISTAIMPTVLMFPSCMPYLWLAWFIPIIPPFPCEVELGCMVAVPCEVEPGCMVAVDDKKD
jgi:hypothetical protein